VSARPTDLVISTAPFAREVATTPRIMLEVLAAALLVLVFACWNFGVSSLLVVAAATAGALGTERMFAGPRERSTLGDYSAALTGVLLGLTLPPIIPLWMAFLGGVAGIGLGKLIWGGLGQNLFNPALIGRAFLQAAFPTAITTWAAPAPSAGFFAVPSSLLALPLMQGKVDAVSAATPLGLAKFENELTGFGPLLFGQTAGSVGETSAVLLILCGVWLAARRIFDWRPAVSTLAAVAIFSGALHSCCSRADCSSAPSSWSPIRSPPRPRRGAAGSSAWASGSWWC
jgi:electron transport complex protein RnfD